MDRETAGRLVRETWVACASEDPTSPAHHLTGWDDLDERNKEIDRRIGETLTAAVLAEIHAHRPGPDHAHLTALLGQRVRVTLDTDGPVIQEGIFLGWATAATSNSKTAAVQA